MMMRLMGSIREFLRREDGMQTMEWLLLIALIGTVLLGLMRWFQGNETMVGNSIWGLIQSWLEKAKPS